MDIIYNDTIITYDENNQPEKFSIAFDESLDCFQVEIIKNTGGCNAAYRIEMADNDYLELSRDELVMLRELLNEVIDIIPED